MKKCLTQGCETGIDSENLLCSKCRGVCYEPEVVLGRDPEVADVQEGDKWEGSGLGIYSVLKVYGEHVWIQASDERMQILSFKALKRLATLVERDGKPVVKPRMFVNGQYYTAIRKVGKDIVWREKDRWWTNRDRIVSIDNLNDDHVVRLLGTVLWERSPE
jgi:hypothetical protein